MRAAHHARPRSAFTLIELLVVVAIMGLLMAILLPSLSKARKAGVRTVCLSNIRGLQIAQAMYAADYADLIVTAGDGTEQGSWQGLLRPYGAEPEARRCPADESEFYDLPIPGTNPPRLRMTSYGLNNYVSPTHAPFGRKPVRRITEVKRPGRVIHMAELAEKGPYAGADHLHVQDFYLAIAPQITIGLIDVQMALGRHGGAAKSWEAMLNFSFLDGHAETLAIRTVYTDPARNLFDPQVAE